jgi:hypothetical protein
VTPETVDLSDIKGNLSKFGYWCSEGKAACSRRRGLAGRVATLLVPKLRPLALVAVPRATPTTRRGQDGHRGGPGLRHRAQAVAGRLPAAAVPGEEAHHAA